MAAIEDDGGTKMACDHAYPSGLVLRGLDPALLPNGSSILHIAAAGGNVRGCMSLVEGTSSNTNVLETVDLRSRTPLAAALLNGRVDTSRYLLRHGACTDAMYAQTSTIRHYLESYACLEFTASLVKEGIGVGDFIPNEVFLASARDGDRSLMQVCLEQYQVDANHCDELGRTALHETCLKGYSECTTLLVQHRARLDVYDNSQSTPLHYACRYGHKNTINLLATAYGQTIQQIVDIADSSGRTPLHAAAEYHHMDVLLLLLQLYSCNTEAPDNCGVTVQGHLYWAYLDCRMDVISLLPFVAYLTQDFRDTLLHQAVFLNQIEVASQLIRAGARVDQFDPSANHNPLLLAARLGETDMVALLLQEGASATTTDGTLQTPLHLAARCCHDGTVARLLQEGTIDVNALDRRGYTAFYYALEQKHAPTVECFLDHYKAHAANPCPGGSSVNKVLDLLAGWEDEGILNRALPLFGDVVASLTAAENVLLGNVQPPLPNAATGFINPGQIQKLDFATKQNSPYPAFLQRHLLKAQLCRSIVCLFCLGLVPKKLFKSHFNGRAGSCRESIQERNSENGRKWFSEAATAATAQQIQSLNKATLAKLCSLESAMQSKKSEGISMGCRLLKQKRVWQHLHNAQKLHKPRSPAGHAYFPLHTAAHAGNASFLVWVLGRTSSRSEQQLILTNKNAAGQTVIEIIVRKDFAKKIASSVDHAVFEKLVQDVDRLLLPPLEEKKPAVTFRRTWSMRVREDVKTAHERSQDIIQKKKHGSRMRLTDSDYTLLCHSLYHQPTLSHDDSEVITGILVSRLKIAGSRTTPCTCRCSAHSRVLYLHRTVHLVLQCYCEGVQRERLQKIINALCLHHYLDSSLQWREVENSLDAPHKLMQWWAVFTRMVQCQVPNLLTAVCMFGDADQAKVLLPWAPDGILMEEDPDMELNALQHAVRRTQPSLTRLLLEELPEEQMAQIDRDGDLLVLCCYGDLRCMNSFIVKKLSANKDLSAHGIQSGTGDMWCLDFEQRRRQLLDLLLSRRNYMASPESLDSALCEAVQRGWWWGASRLVAAGASAHAAYKTTMWGQEEVTRFAVVDCLNVGQTDTFCAMLSGVSTAMLQNTYFAAELVRCLPRMTAEGLHEQVSTILQLIPNPAMLWEGLHPPACQLAQVRQMMGVTPLEVPLPEQLQDSHLRAMAKYGMTDSLATVLQRVSLPCRELCYSHLVHLAASSGQFSTVEAVYEHLNSYGTGIQNELQAVTQWSISAPWSDSESLFWSVVLYSAASCGHEGLALRAITRIMSAALNMTRCMTEIQNPNWGYTVLHWVCYWGMESLLVQIGNLLPEHLIDLHRAPLTPLDCAIGMARLSAIANLLSPGAIVADLTSHFFDFESDSSSVAIPLLKQFHSTGVQLSMEPGMAALFHLLTLGWFTRLMESNRLAAREGVSEEDSELSILHALTKPSTSSDTRTIAASINHFLCCLMQGEDTVVSAFLGGLKLPVLSETLLMMLMEESSVPLFQLAARSCSVSTVVTLIRAFSKAPRSSINFTCPNALWPALFISAQNGNAPITSELLSHGADMGHRDKQKQNVLHIAVSSGSVETVKCLIHEKHSKILMLEASAFGFSPLQIAILTGSYEMVFAMKDLVPAKRWVEQTESHQTCSGWFDYLMEQNALGWVDQGFTAVPSAAYSLRASTIKPLEMALYAARYNHPFILYSILHNSTGLAKQMCDMKEAYLPAFAEVALTQENTILPHIKVSLLVQRMQAEHEESMVQLLNAKFQHDPLYLTDASSLAETGDCFRVACEIGSKQLLSCLMDFGVLGGMSEPALMEGLKDMIMLGYADSAAQFLFDTSLSLVDTGWNWDQFPLILQSIFNPNFNLAASFNWKKMGCLAFPLQDMWLSYKGWTPALLQLVQSTNGSIDQVASVRKQGAVALPLPDQPPVPLTVDWQAFDRLSDEMRSCSCLQHCPLLTECVVFSSMVVHGLAQLCVSTSEAEVTNTVYISVAMDSDPDLRFTDDSCCICLSYSTHHKALVFPELPGRVFSPCPVWPVPHLEFADVVQSVFTHSLKQVLDGKHEVVSDSREVEEQWIQFPESHDAILAVVVHLAADLEAVLSTLFAPSFQLFPKASGPQLSGSSSHTSGTVLQSSYSSLVTPVLRRLQEVHVKLATSEQQSAFFCNVEDGVLELTYTLVADGSIATNPRIEGSSPDAVLESLAACLLQARSEELVNNLCCRLRQAFAVSNSSLGDTDVAITMPDGQLLENVEEPKLQAAMLKWLLSPASSLMIFLELVDVAKNIPTFKASFRSLLQNGLNINLQERGCFGLSTKMGVFNLTVPVIGEVTYLGPLFADLAASCSVPSSLHSLASLERFVYPSKCRLTQASTLALQYATVGTLEFSVLLCNCSGKVADGEPSNLASVDITITSSNASKSVQCHWQRDDPQQTTSDPLLSIRMDPDQGCISCVWQAQDTHCHSMRIRVNGADISDSPMRLFVGSNFKSVDHSPMTSVHSSPSLPSRYLTHSLDQVSHWFLVQDHGGEMSCGAGRPLVFLLSHAHGKACTSIPKASVPARLQRTSTGDIVKTQLPTYSRLPSISGNSPSPQPGTSHEQLPQHFLTVCAQRGGYSSWLTLSAGNVQVLILPQRSVSKKDITYWKQSIRVHSVKLDCGRYRLAVLQPYCGAFRVMAACASCQEVLQVHSHAVTQLSMPILCTVVPGLVVPHHAILASSMAGVQAVKRGVKQKDSLPVCEAGKQVTFYFCLRDIFYNCLTSDNGLGSLRLCVLYAGRRETLYSPPPNAPCTVIYIQNGIFKATCTPYSSGMCPIMLGKSILPQGKLHVCHIAPSVETTTVSHPSSVLLSDRQWTCVIKLRDVYGNAVLSRSSNISITATLNGTAPVSTDVRQVPMSPGTYHGTVFFCGAGVYEVTVRVNGQPLSDTPIQFTIKEQIADKYAKLREYLKKWWCQGSTPTMTVDRANILEHAINLLTDQVLRKTIRVRFKDEPGIDIGGVSREFFELLGEALVNPNYALFEEVGGRFRPNPNSSINPNHLLYFNFTGKILAKAVADGHLLTVRFTPTLYKHLCGQPCTLYDLQEEDPTLHSGLVQVSQCSSASEVSSLHLTFTSQRSRFGSVQTAELEPGGATKEVTLDNRDEYLQKIVEYYMHGSVKEQLKQLKEGFNMLIPSHLLVSFSAKELEQIISGEHGINVSALQRRTKYMAGYHNGSKAIQWLWDVLGTFSEEMQGKFLLFCTGSSSVPASFMEWHLGISRTSNQGQLPTASTCSRVLFLPDYDSKEELKEKLTQAVSMGAYSFHLH